MEEQTSISSEQPLLRSPSPSPSPSRPRSTGSSRRLSLLIGRTVGRRGPSILVRETAARRLEERRANWAHSRPIVALDFLWNLAFSVASSVVLSSTLSERPNVPARLWIAGYALQCIVHDVLVWVEYRRRMSRVYARRDGADSDRSLLDSDREDSEDDDDEEPGRNSSRSIARRCESFNTMASFVWWIVGFYWVVIGGEAFLQNAPKLYWLTVVFLACDVFFALFCVILACVIGIALCCCLPCIIAILYSLTGQEGASDADISILPKFKYKDAGSGGQKVAKDGGIMTPVGNNPDEIISERFLSREDAECCICLTPYDDGADIHSLPCNHHFHSACIIKWLRIHATCPLCKYNILKGNDHV